MENSVPGKRRKAAPKKRPSRSSKSVTPLWILPEDPLFKAFAAVPVADMLAMFPPAKQSLPKSESSSPCNGVISKTPEMKSAEMSYPIREEGLIFGNSGPVDEVSPPLRGPDGLRSASAASR